MSGRQVYLFVSEEYTTEHKVCDNIEEAGKHCRLLAIANKNNVWVVPANSILGEYNRYGERVDTGY